MKGFRGVGGAQRFPAAFIGIPPHFRPPPPPDDRPGYRTEMTTRLAVWDQITSVVGLPAAA